MKAVGVYLGHDQCVAFGEGGRVCLALEEERPTRVKHTHPPPRPFPSEGLGWLARLGHPLDWADVIALAGPTSDASGLGGDAQILGVPHLHDRVRVFEHHLCHLATAYAWSGFDDCYALAIDGGGSDYYGVAARCQDGFISLVAVDSMQNRLSVTGPGPWYLTMTWVLGFKPIRDEGKVMCLADHGDPARFRDVFLSRYDIRPFDVRDRTHPGEDRDLCWHPTPETVREALGGLDPTEGRVRADLAATTQELFERMIFADLEAYVPRGARVVLAGGCFANVKVNRRILDYASEVFVAPPMHDGGLAAGAVMLAPSAGAPPHVAAQPAEHMYLGYDVGPMSPSVSPREVARLVAGGVFVGLCHGPCEYGPRALGNRTILADPRRADTAARLNAALGRSGFMPFAPVVSAEHADEVLESTWHRAARAAEFMTVAFKVRPGHAADIPAVVHIDGTCRPQVLRREVNPFYWDVLEEFYRMTGVPLLLNTSFNRHNEPIVMTIEDAARVLESGGVDALASPEGLRRRA